VSQQPEQTEPQKNETHQELSSLRKQNKTLRNMIIVIVIIALTAVITTLLVKKDNSLSSASNATNTTNGKNEPLKSSESITSAQALIDVFIARYNKKQFNLIPELFSDNYFGINHKTKEQLYQEYSGYTNDPTDFQQESRKDTDSTHAEFNVSSKTTSKNGSDYYFNVFNVNAIVENGVWKLDHIERTQRVDLESSNLAFTQRTAEIFAERFNRVHYIDLVKNFLFDEKVDTYILADYAEQYSPLTFKDKDVKKDGDLYLVNLTGSNGEVHTLHMKGKFPDFSAVVKWEVNGTVLTDRLFGKAGSGSSALLMDKSLNQGVEDGLKQWGAIDLKDIDPDLQKIIRDYFTAFNNKKWDSKEFTRVFDAPIKNQAKFEAYSKQFGQFDINSIRASGTMGSVYVVASDSNGILHGFYLDKEKYTLFQWKTPGYVDTRDVDLFAEVTK
jgi:hypothetical protein